MLPNMQMETCTTVTTVIVCNELRHMLTLSSINCLFSTFYHFVHSVVYRPTCKLPAHCVGCVTCVRANRLIYESASCWQLYWAEHQVQTLLCYDYELWQTVLTRKPSWRKGYARQRPHSKMAVSHHLGYYRTGNITIRSADSENPRLEPNMEWIGCTICEIFAFKLYCDLETGVRGHSRSSKTAPLYRQTQKIWP